MTPIERSLNLIMSLLWKFIRVYRAKKEQETASSLTVIFLSVAGDEFDEEVV